MRTLLIVVAAIAVPLLVLLPMIAAERHNVSREGRSWRVTAKTGSALSLLISAALLTLGASLLVRALDAANPWSSAAVAVALLTEGVRTAFLFFPSATQTSTQFVYSHFVRAGGYVVVALLLVVASIRESWWNLLFAGLAIWLAAMSAHFGRNRSRFHHTPAHTE